MARRALDRKGELIEIQKLLARIRKTIQEDTVVSAEHKEAISDSIGKALAYLSPYLYG